MKVIATIVLRTYNEQDWIAHCLKAIRKQKFKNYEIIIVDNFSTDNTLKVARAFGVNKIVRIKKFVPGKALNMGSKVAKGKILVYLSAHCIPENDKWLESLIFNFKNPKVAAVYGKQSPIKFSRAEDIRDLYITFGNERRVQKKDYFFHNANSAIRKSIWKKIPFSNTLTNIEDRDWSKKIIDKKYHIVYEPKSNVFHYHGIHHGTNTKRLQSTIKVIKKIEKKQFLQIPETFKPENIKLLIVLNFSNYQDNKFYKKILIKTLDDVLKLNFNKKIFFIKPLKFVEKINFKHFQVYNSKQKNLSDILKYALKKNINANYFADYVLYLNADYLFRPINIINKLLKEICNNGYDSLIPVFKHFNTNFIMKDNNLGFDVFGKNLQNRNKKLPSYLSYYGIGTLVKTKVAQKGLLLSDSNNGLFEVKNKLHTIRLSEITKKKSNIFTKINEI